MARKKEARARKSSRHRNSRTPVSGLAPRNHLLDAVRGIAIVLMVIDHVAGILFRINITPDSIRFVTRLAMPLFAILMGYFLASSTRVNSTRLLQLVVATIAINVLFYPYYHQVDILASLLVCYLLWACLGKAFAIFCLASLLFPWDASGRWFDFSLSIVTAMVAQGMVLRYYGLRIAIATGLLITLSGWQIPAPSIYVLYFTLPATVVIHFAAKRGDMPVPLLETLGRYPLTAYVVQYYVIFAIAKWISSRTAS